MHDDRRTTDFYVNEGAEYCSSIYPTAHAMPICDKKDDPSVMFKDLFIFLLDIVCTSFIFTLCSNYSLKHNTSDT